MLRLSVLAVLTCVACEVPPEAKPPMVPAPAAPPEAPASDAGRPAGNAVQLNVTDANGLDPATVGNMYGTAREALAHCHQPGGGTVHVRIVKQGASLHMHVEPGATLDPLAHECVLQALSTVDLPDTAANQGGPAVPPSGFTSLLTITW
jgi:hypothetical protein